MGQSQSKDFSITNYYISVTSKQDHTPDTGSGRKHMNGGRGAAVGHKETPNRNLSKISASIKIEFEPWHVTRGACGHEPDGGRGALSLTSAPRLHPSLVRLPLRLPHPQGPVAAHHSHTRLWKTNMEMACLPREGLSQELHTPSSPLRLTGEIIAHGHTQMQRRPSNTHCHHVLNIRSGVLSIILISLKHKELEE